MEQNVPDVDIGQLEMRYSLDYRTTFHSTEPMHLALEELAARNHTSISAVVRRCLENHLGEDYPEYPNIYKRILIEQADRPERINDEPSS